MNHIERQDSLEYIANKIRQGNTGSLDEFAQTCQLTKDALFDRIEVLRQYTGRESVKILYDKDKKTYYFSQPGKFSDFKFIKTT